MLRRFTLLPTLIAALALAACSAGDVPVVARSPLLSPASTGEPTPHGTGSVAAASGIGSAAATSTRVKSHATTSPALKAGNPAGHASIPAAARGVNTAKPDHVIGKGSPSGCTSAAVVRAVAAGGITTFNCGRAPITIRLSATAKVINAHPDVVLDGGGRVTLSGGGKRRILYQNTCDKAQGWTTSHCNDQAHPRLTVQNLTLADGNSTGQTTDGGGGGGIFVRGGRLKVVNARFIANTCDRTGPDLGGAAIRVLDQAGAQPVYVVGSTFGGTAAQAGRCSNGGALSSIGVSWVILNSLFSHNSAIGSGANPQRAGTPGGGSGGAIYTDGNTYTVSLDGTRIVSNHAQEGGGAIFYVSNDHSGSLTIKNSTLTGNPSKGFETQGYPGIFYLGTGSHPTVIRSHLS